MNKRKPSNNHRTARSLSESELERLAKFATIDPKPAPPFRPIQKIVGPQIPSIPSTASIEITK